MSGVGRGLGALYYPAHGGRGMGGGPGGRGTGRVYPCGGAIVKRGRKAPLVAQPTFLATVLAGGPEGSGGVERPCRVAFHPPPLDAGTHSQFPGHSMFNPDVVGGPGSALSTQGPPSLALGPNGLGAKPTNRQVLQNPGFHAGAFPWCPGMAPAANVKMPVAQATGIDANNCVTTGMWFYNTATPAVLDPAPGVARQPRSLLVHDISTGVATNVSVTNSITGDLGSSSGLQMRRRFGTLMHMIDLIGRDEHLHQLRQASYTRDGHVTLKVNVDFVTWTPDADICDTLLPHGDEDAWAALYTHLLGTQEKPATRATWDALGLKNMYSIFLPGPDGFVQKSWHDQDHDHRLVRGAENGARVATPATRGSHVHAVCVSVEQCDVDPTSATTVAAQVALDQLHRFARSCGMGQELVYPNNGDPGFNLNYWMSVSSLSSVVKTIGYATVGKNGLRSPHWRPAANWARAVLAASNLETQWSEKPNAIRSAVGRLAGVARMPFSSLADIPRSY